MSGSVYGLEWLDQNEGELGGGFEWVDKEKECETGGVKYLKQWGWGKHMSGFSRGLKG